MQLGFASLSALQHLEGADLRLTLQVLPETTPSNQLQSRKILAQDKHAKDLDLSCTLQHTFYPHQCCA